MNEGNAGTGTLALSEDEDEQQRSWRLHSAVPTEKAPLADAHREHRRWLVQWAFRHSRARSACLDLTEGLKPVTIVL